MASTPEGRIKAKVKARLQQEFGASHWRFMPVQTGYGSVALDLLLCLSGRFVAIETKADKSKKLTPLQQTTSAAIRSAGGLVFVVFDDESLDATIETIKWKLNWKPDERRDENYRDGNADPQGPSA